MRKSIALLTIAAMMATSTTGCVAVNAKSTRIGMAREVVAVNGKVYLIDTECGTAREVDLAAAKPFDPHEVHDHESVEIEP